MPIEIIIIVIGLIASCILFRSFPFMKNDNSSTQFPKVSVIIPARNEEKNLPLLLDDLNNQTVCAYEVICVDDGSTDNTAKIVAQRNAKLISIKEKPKEWMGKSWACQKGAEAAEGELLLFLDADVRLSPNGLKKLIQTYNDLGCAISVEPYHKMKKLYEQFSMFFNIVQVGANGLAMPNSNKIGLYGPVILISQLDYQSIDGHASVKSEVIEDVALGIKMRQAGIPYKLYLGDDDIYFRMYSGGFSDLFHGWLKNFATGASVTPLFRFLMVFLWVTSCTSVPINIIAKLFQMDLFWLSIYTFLYFIWVIELQRISRHLGNFNFCSIVFYPVTLIVFVLVFILSLIKKVFHLKNVWKGRQV